MNSLELFVFLQKNMTSMKKVELKSVILECQMEELSAEDRQLVEQAIEATSRSYAPYSHFHVGAAVRLENGKTGWISSKLGTITELVFPFETE